MPAEAFPLIRTKPAQVAIQTHDDCRVVDARLRSCREVQFEASFTRFCRVGSVCSHGHAHWGILQRNIHKHPSFTHAHTHANMRPIMINGHERSLTQIKYNREGDLLFSVSKDIVPSVWFSDNGERLGTFDGHNGAVWCSDVRYDTSAFISGSADNTLRLWDVETGGPLVAA